VTGEKWLKSNRNNQNPFIRATFYTTIGVRT